MICTGIEMQDLTVTNDIALSCKGSHTKYVATLEEKREVNESSDRNKRKLLCEEIADVKRQWPVELRIMHCNFKERC